jgi:hypothetical protein
MRNSSTRRKALKNIARPVRVYAVRVDAGPSLGPATWRPSKLARLASRSSCFLANLGGDSEQDYFVDGVTESLTTDLSRIRGSIVIARNTRSFWAKLTSRNAGAAERALCA